MTTTIKRLLSSSDLFILIKVVLWEQSPLPQVYSLLQKYILLEGSQVIKGKRNSEALKVFDGKRIFEGTTDSQGTPLPGRSKVLKEHSNRLDRLG